MKDILDSKITTLMKDDVLCVHLQSPIREVVDVMMTQNIHGVGVVDDKGNCQGFLTTFDIICHLERMKVAELANLKAEDIMTKMVIDINPNYTIRQAIKIMHELHIHHLVVGSAHSQTPNKPAGIISAMDVMAVLKQRLKK